MATAAQIDANTLNAQSSTGPRTAEGKAASARNATKLGLFSIHDLVRPDQELEYKELAVSFWRELVPHGPLQTTFATEIVRANWRLRRCELIEAGLLDTVLDTGLDPMQNEATLKIQNAVDRARAQALCTIRRCAAELRRLQTDRRIAEETMPGEDCAGLGLISIKEVSATLHKQFKAKESQTIARIRSIVRDGGIPAPHNAALATQQTQSEMYEAAA